VARDVAEDLVSEDGARRYYGVVLSPAGAVDRAATLTRRDEERANRRAHASAWTPDDANPPDLGSPPVAVSDLDDNLLIMRVGSADVVACRHCATLLGDMTSFSMESLPAQDVELASAGGLWWSDPTVYLDVDVTFRQYYCPGCYTALEGAVSPIGHPVFVSRPVLT
jgi:N-methylhydantoinase B